MANCPRLMLFAATAIAATLWIAAPVLAADSTIPPREAAMAGVKTAPAGGKHRTWRGSRLTAARYHLRDRLTPMHSKLDCSGVWCGRQFVLMIGVGY